MKKLVVFLLFFLQHIMLFSQIGLPVQHSFLPKNSLVVDYDFIKPSSYVRGGTTVTNTAGLGNASVIGSPNLFNSLGFVTFNGTSQYLMTPNLRPLFKAVNATVQKSFTMSLWFFPKALNGVIVSEHESQTINSGFFTSNIELVAGVINYKVWNSPVIRSNTITINKWYHVAMVYDGASVKAYLNGVLLGTQVYDRVIPPSSQNYGIGAPSTTNMGSGLHGNFDLAQFKLYQLPLSNSDILQEYELRKNELDYIIHSPTTNTNPTYWGVSGTWSGDVFGGGHYTPWLNSNLGWAAQSVGSDLNAIVWITLNYDEPTFIKGVVIQPRANSWNQFVTKVHVETSLTGAAPWTRIVSDVPISTTITDDGRVLFPTSVFAKAVRVIPVTWTNHITMRLGMLIESKSLAPDGLTPSNASTSAFKIKQDYPASGDGFYWIKNPNINNGAPIRIYADMTTSGGGWTLIMKNSSGADWTYSSAIATNVGMPFTTNADVISTTTPNYSIIGWANFIKKSASGFQYMIDAGSRRSFGGIWTANGNYSFVNTNNTQTNVDLNTKFGNWNYVSEDGIMQRMPWYSTNTGGGCGIITTDDGSGNWWGTLIAAGTCNYWTPTPWIENAGGGTSNSNPGIIWYWVR